MDGNTKAIAEALRRWHEAPRADVIDFYAARARLLQRRRNQQRTNNLPMPPRPAA